MQCFSQSGATDNIDLKDTWFTTDIEEHPRETPIQKTSIPPENNNQPQSKPAHTKIIPVGEGVLTSELNEHPVSGEIGST